MGRNAKYTEWQAKILAATDIRGEFSCRGVEFTRNEPNAGGWLPCRSPFRDDRDPSCAVNVASTNGQLGWFKDSAGEKLGPYEFLHKLAPSEFADWKAAREYLAQKAGVPFPKKSAKGGKQQYDPITIKDMRPWCVQFLIAKKGITLDAIKAAGGEAGKYKPNDKS
jgi:hypothetical protein